MVENLPAMQETWVPSWGWENPLKKGMATHSSILGLPRWVLVVRNPPANAGDIRGAGSIAGFGRFPWWRARQPTPVFLLGDSHGQRSLAGYSLQDCKELDVTEVT